MIELGSLIPLFGAMAPIYLYLVKINRKMGSMIAQTEANKREIERLRDQEHRSVVSRANTRSEEYHDN